MQHRWEKTWSFILKESSFLKLFQSKSTFLSFLVEFAFLDVSLFIHAFLAARRQRNVKEMYLVRCNDSWNSLKFTRQLLILIEFVFAFVIQDIGQLEKGRCYRFQFSVSSYFRIEYVFQHSHVVYKRNSLQPNHQWKKNANERKSIQRWKIAAITRVTHFHLLFLFPYIFWFYSGFYVRQTFQINFLETVSMVSTVLHTLNFFSEFVCHYVARGRWRRVRKRLKCVNIKNCSNPYGWRCMDDTTDIHGYYFV